LGSLGGADTSFDKSLLTRLLALEDRHEGQESPRRGLVAIRFVDGTISASIPGQTEPEAFSDEAALEARANELGMRCICVAVVNDRKDAAVAQAYASAYIRMVQKNPGVNRGKKRLGRHVQQQKKHICQGPKSQGIGPFHGSWFFFYSQKCH